MKKNLYSFTLIETIIVITVFCIWILAVFIWASKTIRNQDYATLQIQSSFLAREWIELLFNMRDANYHKELPRNCIFTTKDSSNTQFKEDDNPYCDGYLADNDIFKISIWKIWTDEYLNIEKSKLKDNFFEMFSENQIYFHNDSDKFYYDHNSENGEETFFARYLIIKEVTENWESLPKDKILKVESHVLYRKWWLMWDKVMETFIWDYEF